MYTQCLNECQIMLCKWRWIVLYTVHFTAFCLGGGGRFFRTRCIMPACFIIKHLRQNYGTRKLSYRWGTARQRRITLCISLEMTAFHRTHTTDFLITFNSDYGSILHNFWDIWFRIIQRPWKVEIRAIVTRKCYRSIACLCLVFIHSVPKKPGMHIMANNFHKHRPISNGIWSNCSCNITW